VFSPYRIAVASAWSCRFSAQHGGVAAHPDDDVVEVVGVRRDV
jgi:hypothetical protein